MHGAGFFISAGLQHSFSLASNGKKHTQYTLRYTLINGTCINYAHRSGTHLPRPPVKENEMNASRYTKISAGLLILAVAFVSVSFVTRGLSSINGAGKPVVASNTYLPLPHGKQTQLYNAARGSGDFYQRHNSWSWAVSVPVYSDYFQRHAELSSLAALGQGASDYAERHPELSTQADSSVDLTDYYFRHLSQ
jgi:hypothetical protein